MTTRTKTTSTAAEKRAEKAEAIATLRKLLRPGTEVLTIIRHVEKSGMSRVIDLYVVRRGDLHRLTYSVCAATGTPYDRKHEGARVGGCRMDMGFALVYKLSRVLYPKGFRCTGRDWSYHRETCPSSEHSNRDPRGFERGILHADGGYALRQRWV